MKMFHAYSYEGQDKDGAHIYSVDWGEPGSFSDTVCLCYAHGYTEEQARLEAIYVAKKLNEAMNKLAMRIRRRS